MKYESLPSRVRALCVATACAFLVGACGHDNGGQPGGLAQPAQWARTYGGLSYDAAYSVQTTADGGFVVAGQTNSFGAGGSDAWVLKLDAGGNVLWQKTYGGEGDDSASSIQSTPDGGYVVAGTLNRKLWVSKLDARGSILWQKDYGAGGANAVRLTPDGGYIVAAGAVLKLDAAGNVLWQKAFESSYMALVFESRASSVQPTPDGGYVVAGSSGPFGWVAKLDAGGGMIWQKVSDTGLGLTDGFRSVQIAPDGSYIVTGYYGILKVSLGGSFWVLRLDAGGNVVWQRAYAAGDAYDVQPTPDGGYVVAGYFKLSSTNPYTRNLGVLKLDARGNIVWQKTYAYGSTGGDEAFALSATADGGYIVAGIAMVPGAQPHSDAWVLKLDSSGAITGCAALTELNPVAVDTTAPIAGGAPTGSDSNFTPASSSAVSADSTAVPSEQCHYE